MKSCKKEKLARHFRPLPKKLFGEEFSIFSAIDFMRNNCINTKKLNHYNKSLFTNEYFIALFNFMKIESLFFSIRLSLHAFIGTGFYTILPTLIMII